jgi:hypothetical protein
MTTAPITFTARTSPRGHKRDRQLLPSHVQRGRLGLRIVTLG